jgi:hypothetical protein
MERIVVAAEAVDNGLLSCSLIPEYPVRLTFFRRRLGLWRARNEFRELATGGFGPQIECGALLQGSR